MCQKLILQAETNQNKFSFYHESIFLHRVEGKTRIYQVTRKLSLSDQIWSRRVKSCNFSAHLFSSV